MSNPDINYYLFIKKRITEYRLTNLKKKEESNDGLR